MYTLTKLKLTIVMALVCAFESNGQSAQVGLLGVYTSSGNKFERYSIMTLELNNRFTYKYGVGGCQGEVTGHWKIVDKKIAFENDPSFLKDSIIHYPNLGLTVWTVKTIGIKPDEIVDSGCLREGNLHFKE